MKRLPWFLACLPPVTLLCLYLGYALDFPRLDQWEFVLFLDKAYSGQLTFHDFWAQHNEHRILFPRLLMLALARLSSWDIRWELCVNFALGMGLFMAYMACCRYRGWTVPLVSLAVFSMAQWRNWFLGWQMQVFMGLLATLGVLLLLNKRPVSKSPQAKDRPTVPKSRRSEDTDTDGSPERPAAEGSPYAGDVESMFANSFGGHGSRPGSPRGDRRGADPARRQEMRGEVVVTPAENRNDTVPASMETPTPSESSASGEDDIELPWWRVVVAVLLALVATYSFANGMLAWPLGLLVLLLNTAGPRRWSMAAVWCAVSACAILAYFHGYTSPAYHGEPFEFIKRPIAFPLYIFAYLGQPVCGFGLPSAGLAGVVGLFRWMDAVRRDPARQTLPLALGLYTIVTAIVTAAGRVEFGAEQALSSRYVTLALPLWIAIIAAYDPKAPWEPWTRLRKGAFVALLVATSLYGGYRWTERYHAMAPARAALIEGRDHEAYRFIYPPDPGTVLERRDILVKHRLSVFAETE